MLPTGRPGPVNSVYSHIHAFYISKTVKRHMMNSELEISHGAELKSWKICYSEMVKKNI